MYYLFEESDLLSKPVECFVFDASRNSFPIRPHWHYFTEIIFMLDGCAEMFADGERHLLSEGDMILFHPKAVHSIYAVNASPPVYSVLKFDINLMNLTPSYAPKLRSMFRIAEKNRMNIYFPSDSETARSAGRILSACIGEEQGREYGFDMVIKAQIYSLLVGIIRAWKAQGFLVDSDAFAEDNHYDIYNITEYIDSNMSAGIRVADIAEKCGMSYSYFARKFSSVYGKSCKEYIDAIRLFKVEEFLVFTDFDLNYISQETGFSDCSHMIKSFRKLKGITPKQFRMKHTGGSGKTVEKS